MDGGLAVSRGVCVDTDVGGRRVVPGVDRLPTHPLPILTVIAQSPRCLESTGHGKAAVHPRSMPIPLSAGFLWPEGISVPSPGRPSSPQPLLLSASRSFWDAPWRRASIFLERPAALAPCQALSLRGDFLGRRWAQPAVGGQRGLLTSEDSWLCIQPCFQPPSPLRNSGFVPW